MTGNNRFICFQKLIGLAFRYTAVMLVHLVLYHGSCLLALKGKELSQLELVISLHHIIALTLFSEIVSLIVHFTFKDEVFSIFEIVTSLGLSMITSLLPK